MSGELQRLHHVGIVVEDMEKALALYQRLGFACPPPSYPMMSEKEGEVPKPLGAANTHATFPRNFIEILTISSDGSRIPSGAHLVPLKVPPAALPRILETVRRTVATLTACLERFQGLHILVFLTADVAASAARFDSEGVGHSGANVVQRPVETANGAQMVPVRYLEIDREPVPEGRLAIAENPTSEVLHAQRHIDHPNGAVDLVESVLCVADSELDVFSKRYRRYLGRDARVDGAARVFDLEASSRLTLVPASALGTILPGEVAPALPAFVGYAVAVRNLDVTRAHLKRNNVPVTETEQGDLCVPATAAMGAAVIFRQLRQ